MTPKQAHWDAIAAMDFNTSMVARISGHLPVVSKPHEAEAAWTKSDVVLLSPTLFLRHQQATSSLQLPESWSVSSDSIAAFTALHWPAKELLFCKSCDLPKDGLTQICNTGLLDLWVPELMPSLRNATIQLKWLNLNADHGGINRIRWT